MRTGIPVSPGIAVARAYCVEHPLAWDEPHHLDAAVLSGEITRFEEACNAAVRELDDTIARVSQEIGDDEATIFRAHRLLLRDNTLVNRVKDAIRERRVDAATALHQVLGATVDERHANARVLRPTWPGRKQGTGDAHR